MSEVCKGCGRGHGLVAIEELPCCSALVCVDYCIEKWPEQARCPYCRSFLFVGEEVEGMKESHGVHLVGDPKLIVLATVLNNLSKKDLEAVQAWVTSEYPEQTHMLFLVEDALKEAL